MIGSYQPHIDKTNLPKDTKVRYWRSIYYNGTVTIDRRDDRTRFVWYFTKEGVRVAMGEITHVMEAV